MEIKQRIAEFHDEMTDWRRDIHTHPETAFEEVRTSQLVADKLEEFGIEVHRGLAGTGVVGILKGKSDGEGTIGLRADMDALHITEQTNLPYRSANDGKMHACGHDGHTTMLLGAAKYLAETRDFSGTAYFVFQPAEENEAGGQKMVQDGLFENFPMDGIYGMHNWPGMPLGKVGAKVGPMMAATDTFDITITGRGGHAAMPHDGVDTIVVASQVVSALQTIASRNVNPVDTIVVSVTQFHGGDTYNVLPEEVTLCGTVRTFDPEVQATVEPAMLRIINGICAAHGATAEFRMSRSYPATINHAAETEKAARVAASVVGNENVDRDVKPSMGAEDFAYMLKETPGSYIWIGAGEDRAKLHSPYYDFNDDLLPIGATYWAELVEQLLPASEA